MGPQWRGHRSIGGCEFWASAGTAGESAGREYGLVHGDGHPEARPDLPYVRVVTSTSDVLEWSLRSVLESKTEPPPEFEEIERIAAEEELDSSLAGAVEHSLTIPVDGDPVVFEAITRGVAWVARSGFDAYAITVQARHFDPAQVSLVRITDLAPYVRGWHEQRARLRPYDQGG